MLKQTRAFADAHSIRKKLKQTRAFADENSIRNKLKQTERLQMTILSETS
jgi:hypothetical protein